MRLLLWSMMFSVLMLCIVSEIVSPTVKQQWNVHTLPVHKTLYLARSIYNEEAYHVIEAAIEWNETTNGEVVFDIKWMPQHDIDMSDAIIVLNVEEDSPDIIMLDSYNAVHRYETMAYFDDRQKLKSISLVDGRILDAQYAPIMLHELGHSLGLEHIKGDEGIGTLMSEVMDNGSDHITNKDFVQFCQIYHCDASKFHGQPM